MVFYLFILWLVSVLVAVCCLAKEEWHNKAKWYLCWALFPFPLILYPRRLGIIKSWMLFLVSPFMFFILLLLFCILLCIAMSQSEKGVPSSIPYHTAGDLKRITGVEFPKVKPVDSTYVNEWMYYNLSIKFVPRRPMNKNDFSRFEQACKDDPCCWTKDSLGYHYHILPELPIDRPNGTHHRYVEFEGKRVKDWQGEFITLDVPLHGDTIYVSEGWSN